MSAALWTAAEAARATGGRVSGDWEATGISIDSRTVAPGDLFVALSAARDGHDFVADALARGAVAALVSRVPDGVAPTNLLVVEDVMAGLEALGRACPHPGHRDRDHRLGRQDHRQGDAARGPRGTGAYSRRRGQFQQSLGR